MDVLMYTNFVSSLLTMYDLCSRFYKNLSLDIARPSTPLDHFSKQNLTIIKSNLVSPPPDRDKGIYHLQKPIPQPDGSYKATNVESGFLISGIDDALALAKLSIVLTQKKTTISIKLDMITNEEKRSHLILLGGSVSNRVAHELHRDYLPMRHQFYTAEGMTIHGTTCRGGEYGHILFMANPWEPAKRVLWLAGLGPLGTGAAVDFLLNRFNDHAPKEILKTDSWILFTKANLDSKGTIQEIVQIGHCLI